MKFLLPLLALFVYGGIAAFAQSPLAVFGTVAFSLDDGSAQAPLRTFGFSSEYTDGADCFTHNECEIPGPPPDGLYPMFVAQPNADYWLDGDVRGVPDSVGPEAIHHFSLVYEFDVRNTDGKALRIAVASPLPTGIDSIRFTDNITSGTVFNYTFDREGGSVAVPDPAITEMHMTVYYDLTPIITAVPSAPAVADFQPVSPCPVLAGQMVDLGVRTPAGSVVVQRDVAGTVVARSAGNDGAVRAPSRPGVYFLDVLDRDGQLVRRARIVVVQ